MSSGPANSGIGRLRPLLLRAAAIVAIGAALGLLSNALHPMGVPMALGEVEWPGTPVWVWERVDQLEPDQAHALLEDGSVIVVDARDASEYSTARLPGSINLPYHDFTSTYPQVRERLPEDGPILLYCHEEGCPLAMRVSKRLLQGGCEELILLRGGIIAWRNAGYDIVVPPPAGGTSTGGEDS
ncbi:MAG: rhodanese-like domain-containing protein [Armatimonadota bacterium]|jgi:rhodanese-related sulfurtransferase